MFGGVQGSNFPSTFSFEPWHRRFLALWRSPICCLCHRVSRLRLSSSDRSVEPDESETVPITRARSESLFTTRSHSRNVASSSRCCQPCYNALSSLFGASPCPNYTSPLGDFCGIPLSIKPGNDSGNSNTADHGGSSTGSNSVKHRERDRSRDRTKEREKDHHAHPCAKGVLPAITKWIKKYNFFSVLVMVLCILTILLFLLKTTTNIEGIVLDDIELRPAASSLSSSLSSSNSPNKDEIEPAWITAALHLPEPPQRRWWWPFSSSSPVPVDPVVASARAARAAPSARASPLRRTLPVPKVRSRMVHIDLTGMPPTALYLQQLIPFLAEWGATHLLIEWADMLPYTGRLEALRGRNAYTPVRLTLP